ncbi:hypothetical protein BpHYR1_040424 [Brachionus plicatilis]|uniref:Uncharacterized protein n=1 Tax=Brachionus plicatilis TaxID=10195 RepID=A0A3M7RKZ2_BRAPC|nr:hypothetical protein BpHYR1_040424 [Brachionus plicatilis]
MTIQMENENVISNRLFELSERYVRAGLSHSILLVVRLVEEYREGFEARHIEYPTPLTDIIHWILRPCKVSSLDFINSLLNGIQNWIYYTKPLQLMSLQKQRC